MPKGTGARTEATLNTAVPARPRTKIRADARGRDGGVHQELAAGVKESPGRAGALGNATVQVLDENGKALGIGPTAEAAIAAAAAAMDAGSKQHCAQMGITPRAVIENFLANEDYELVAMTS